MKPIQPHQEDKKSSKTGLKIGLNAILECEYDRVYEEELKKIDENNFAREAIARHYANRWLQLQELKDSFKNN